VSSLATIRALHTVYKFNKSAAQYLLLRAENAILEVPDDDNEDERPQVQPPDKEHRTAEPTNEEEAREPPPEPKEATANDEEVEVERMLRRRPNLRLNRPERNWDEDEFGDELPATPGGWDEQWT
jgi:hypothetical protein